ncbi:MAG: SDR family oxidoreductase, partial [Dehalococcoidia bacterium]|nr:SDR family oxidoreductase [Dehalococcoidia bacterium]
SVIVTGGGSNIGRAIFHAFAAEGCNIAIADIDQAQGERVAGEVTGMGAGARVFVVKTDVSDHEQVETMVSRAIQEYGGVDVLVNNVGWTVDRLFMEKPREEWEREVRLNLWSPINCIRAVLPHMIEKQGGSIVSISSDAGRMGEFREAVYSACNGGVIALSKAVAREMGRYGIRLNVVCPGLTVPQSEEEMGQDSMWLQMRDIFTDEVLERVRRGYVLRRLGTADELAKSVVFLSSDAASFVTGQTLSVSGGYTMM